jgi:hypothetical protein
MRIPGVLSPRPSFKRTAVGPDRPSGKHRTLLAAAALAIFTMIGWTVALQRQPTASLPSFTNSTLEQELPFGPVKLVPREATKTAAPAHRMSAPMSAAPKTAATAQPSAPVPNQTAAKKSSPAIKARPSHAAARRRLRPADSEVADDEVIVHQYGPSASPKAVLSKTGPRRISDID